MNDQMLFAALDGHWQESRDQLPKELRKPVDRAAGGGWWDNKSADRRCQFVISWDRLHEPRSEYMRHYESLLDETIRRSALNKAKGKRGKYYDKALALLRGDYIYQVPSEREPRLAPPTRSDDAVALLGRRGQSARTPDCEEALPNAGDRRTLTAPTDGDAIVIDLPDSRSTLTPRTTELVERKRIGSASEASNEHRAPERNLLGSDSDVGPSSLSATTHTLVPVAGALPSPGQSRDRHVVSPDSSRDSPNSHSTHYRENGRRGGLRRAERFDPLKQWVLERYREKEDKWKSMREAARKLTHIVPEQFKGRLTPTSAENTIYKWILQSRKSDRKE